MKTREELKEMSNAEIALLIKNLERNIKIGNDLMGYVADSLKKERTLILNEIRRRKFVENKKRHAQIKLKNESSRFFNILNAVASHFNMPSHKLKTKIRRQDYVYPRQVCMYLLRENTDLSMEAIARILDKKDHSTIFYGYRKIKELYEAGCERTVKDVDSIYQNLVSNISEDKA